MKAFEIGQFGLDNLKMVEKEYPRPKSKEVLVKIHAASLNYRDYLVVNGKYNPYFPLPLVPLSDGAGEVVEIGEDVKTFFVGDRVTGTFAPDWISGQATKDQLRNTTGGPNNGTLTEFRVYPEHGLLPIPEHLSYEEAAAFPCAALTSWSAMVVEGKVNPGDTVVVLGTGGVSIFALQFAKILGANVIVTSGSDDKLEKAKELGADHTINYKTVTDWHKEVKRITRVGADHIIEVGGAGTLEQSVKSIRPFGQISLIGILAGGSKDFNLLPVLMHNIKIQGIVVGSKAGFESMNKAVAFHKLKPVIDKVFPFEEAKEAIRYLANGNHFGKICIKVSS